MPAHPVVHFEINAPDPTPLHAFYRDLFGWRIDPMEGASYALIDTQSSGGINGGISADERDPFVVFYVASPDIQATLDKAESLGAKTVAPVTEIPDVVTFALFADPSGNTIGLVQDDGTPPERSQQNATAAPVAWFEIISPDAVALWTFYRDLFGWDIDGEPGASFVYGEVDTKVPGGIGGGIGASPNGDRYVAVYAEVPDVAAALARTRDLGGQTVMGPAEVNQGLTVGLLRDPQGGLFGVFARS